MRTFNPECWYKEVCDDVKDGCTKHCAQYLKMRYLMEHCGLPVNKCKPIPLQPEACDRDAFVKLANIKDNIEDFVEDGNNLYITSANVGNGKTSWSIKLLLKYFEQIWEYSDFNVRGLFISVPWFLSMSKDFKTTDPEFEELKRHIATADLVVWDDIACTEISAYDLGQLSTYIDARCLAQLSNIYTGNLPSREMLEKALGTRLTSRIWNARTDLVELKGGDRR